MKAFVQTTETNLQIKKNVTYVETKLLVCMKCRKYLFMKQCIFCVAL